VAQLLDLTEGMKVLEVGAGAGYNAALLAEIVGGQHLVVTVGCSDLSPHWAGQLADGGTMLVPLEHAGSHPLFLIWKDSGELRGRVAHWTGSCPSAVFHR
jgi:protein-L-isoaspartate(D-aspartate) O-methyltransferase